MVYYCGHPPLTLTLTIQVYATLYYISYIIYICKVGTCYVQYILCYVQAWL